MSRISLSTALIVAFLVVACGGAGPSVPTPTDPPAQPSPSVAPSDPPASPVPSPSPIVSPAPASPAPSQPVVVLTAAERHLLAGVRRAAIDCDPVRSGLPVGAIGGIDCASADPAAARIGFYLFDDDATMLDAYLARMADEGIELESGSCVDGEGEQAYVPGEGLNAWRHGCFVNDAGFANYRATLPGAHVYLGILGRTADARPLEDLAWLGNQDTPGSPTLWIDPS